MNQVMQLLNPKGLSQNPAFSQVAVVAGTHRTVYVGGQNAVNEQGEIVGKGDIQAQAKQILENIRCALNATGATLRNLVKWNVYVLAGQNPQPAFEVFQAAMVDLEQPPLLSMVFVAGLAHPDFLMEIEAIAVIADS